MKRLFTVLLSLILGIAMLTFAACADTSPNAPSDGNGQTGGNNESGNNESGDNGDNESGGTTEPQSPATSGDPASDTLVVYFSWSGNTENVAKSIQTQTNSDLFEIVPKTPYSDDYNTVVDLAQEEQKNNARPEIADVIENIDQYDMIYIGFPNWWGDMPMILYTFFDTYDLSGKTIAPFCTSGGSGLSNTVNEMKELEPNAMVTDGLHIGSEASSSPDDAVSQWLNEIGVAE